MARVRNSDSIGVTDLDKLARQFKELGGDTPKRLRETNKKAAQQVAPKARAAAFAQGSTLAHVAPSIKAAAGAQFAGIAGGGPAHPAFGGAEFGGRGRPTTQQFQPWRGNGENAGYAVYPTIRKELPNIEETYRTDIEDLIKEVGLG